MNRLILCAMDRDNRSLEELNNNNDIAKSDRNIIYDNTGNVSFVVSIVCSYAVYHAIGYADALRVAPVDYWISRYFKITGENREDYAKQLNERGEG